MTRYLDQAIKAAGIAIDGVSVGDPNNRATWKVSPADKQAQAQPIIDAFVIPSAAVIADDDAEAQTQDKRLKAVALGLWECIPAPTMTKAQLAARIKAIYKTL